MIKVAILGYGNIGRAAEEAVKAAPDMQLTGIFHHNDCLDCIDADVVLVAEFEPHSFEEGLKYDSPEFKRLYAGFQQKYHV